METNDNKQRELKEISIIGDWIPRKVVQEFFGYGNTKMANFASDYKVTVSKVGKRIFYKYSDLLKLFDDGIMNDNLQ
ncbi:hypothetical protein [Winogradskyella alexanderae]|uniref:DNA-binding protein n=1 Tax=Winogradskyella alexanderae TaxID=2877123 RepID=A0ABS7XT19_9FLAO|nr:hypothetical protein [Winogradskyella alexanderae]MCA0132614.1 hypothetical protein [Winogradskyella alexanderae]